MIKKKEADEKPQLVETSKGREWEGISDGLSAELCPELDELMLLLGVAIDDEPHRVATAAARVHVHHALHGHAAQRQRWVRAEVRGWFCPGLEAEDREGARARRARR